MPRDTSDTKLTQGEGNTLPLPKSRKWCFTLNNYTETDCGRLKILFEMKKWTFIIGQEVGDTNDTPHLQGYVSGKNAIRFDTLKKMMPRAHLEASKGSPDANYKYCSKEGKFITNMQEPAPPAKPIKDPLKDRKLYDFQQEIVDMVKEEPDDRKVFWYYDLQGCKGKTTLAKHLCMNHNALYVQGKANDIKFGVMDMIQKKGEIDIVIMGLPRSYEQYVSYDAIESIKDGIFYSSKYESGMCIFNSPHVIILANFAPDEDKLSKDRWVIKCLDDFEYV